MAENLYPDHETFREYQIEKALLLAHNSPLRLEAEDPLSLFKLAGMRGCMLWLLPIQTAGFLCATWKRTSPNLEREIFLDPAQD